MSLGQDLDEILGSVYHSNSPEALKAFEDSLKNARCSVSIVLGGVDNNIVTGTPHYMGDWSSLDGRDSSYFFMTCQGKTMGKVNGLIEDELGISTFKGEFSESRVKFVKKYLDGPGSRNDIIYEGNITKDYYPGIDIYKGNFLIKRNGGKGYFRLEPYPTDSVRREMFDRILNEIRK